MVNGHHVSIISLYCRRGSRWTLIYIYNSVHRYHCTLGSHDHCIADRVRSPTRLPDTVGGVMLATTQRVSCLLDNNVIRTCNLQTNTDLLDHPYNYTSLLAIDRFVRCAVSAAMQCCQPLKLRWTSLPTVTCIWQLVSCKRHFSARSPVSATVRVCFAITMMWVACQVSQWSAPASLYIYIYIYIYNINIDQQRITFIACCQPAVKLGDFVNPSKNKFCDLCEVSYVSLILSWHSGSVNK